MLQAVIVEFDPQLRIGGGAVVRQLDKEAILATNAKRFYGIGI